MPLIDAITRALCKIEPEQVFHPYHGFQERVFCYELYHRLRVFEDNDTLDIRPARLQAELNKAGKHYFQEVVSQLHAARGETLTWKVPEAAPDLLAHEPETHDHNLLALEAKRWSAPLEEMCWDLAKLALFSAAPLAYRQRVFLVINDRWASPEDIVRDLKERDTGGDDIDLCVWTPTKDLRWDRLRFHREEAVKLFREEVERRRIRAESRLG